MAKDDYDVIVYKILVYYYACLKRRITFDKKVFEETVMKEINQSYFNTVLYFMKEEGLITGLVFANVWGGEHILVTSLDRAEITPDGIHYLKDNSKMKAVGEHLKEAVDVIAKLASMVM